MAKDNPKSTKRTRKGGKRAKSGCSTCRARHVKCDERVPSCSNCTSTGRNCDGYEVVKGLGRQQAPASIGLARLRTNVTSPWNDSSLALARTLGLPSNEQSNQFFHSFLHGCVPSLTEAMDSDFWRRGIARATSSLVVQHAAVAFGAVYEQRLANRIKCETLGSRLSDKRLEILSSLRYATAIQMLRSCIAESPPVPERLEEIMMACLIFIFLELLRGDDIAAATHLDGALDLYNCALPTSETNDVPSNTGALAEIEPLTKAFLRLDVQSVSYIGSRTPWGPARSNKRAFRSQTSEQIPTLFGTFLDARDSLYVHIGSIMNFVTPPEGAEKCFPGWCPHPERGFDIYTLFHGSTYRDFDFPKASSRRRHFMHILSRWKSAFQGYLQKGTAKSPEALAGCALLWLAYYTTRINLSVSYTDHECCYDEQLPSFKKIVEQAETYLKYTAHDLPPKTPANWNNNITGTTPSIRPKQNEFKVHSTVCYPLYYTALKCRYKPLRRVALAMLRDVDSEGIWDAHMLARIAEFVIDVEEEAPLDPSNIPTDDANFGVPEANRIHCLSLNIVKSQRKIWLRYSRRATKPQDPFLGLSEPLKRWRIDDTILIWMNPTPESVEPPEPVHFVADPTPSATLPGGNQTLPYRSSPTER